MTANAFDHGSLEARNADLRKDVAERLTNAPLIACDIETTGLDWSTHRIATVQLYAPGEPPSIVRINGKTPRRIVALLEDDSVVKVFHHAMFDLRFIAHYWGVKVRNVRCTKIAAKLLYPDKRERQSLHALIRDHLGVVIDKSEQTSDWSVRDLSSDQLTYAANDVVYLPDLLDALRERLMESELWELAEACFAHLPARVKLEIGGFGDVFTY